MIIDCFAGIGNLPFRELVYGMPARLRDLLKREGVDRAFVYSIGAIRAKDVMKGNRRVAAAAAEDLTLVPFAPGSRMQITRSYGAYLNRTAGSTAARKRHHP
jgi:hypothetical protein